MQSRGVYEEIQLDENRQTEHKLGDQPDGVADRET